MLWIFYPTRLGCVNGTLCNIQGIRVQIPYTADELCSAALSDKKRNGDTVSLVLPGPIGSCRIENVPVASLDGIIAEALS